MITWNGTDFQERFNELEASGIDVHGEAKCVVELLNSLGWQFEYDKWQFQADKWRLQESQEESSFRPSALVPRVLDAGCGTGRVARELARQEIEVVGVEPNESMLQVARQLSPEIRWVIADMCVIDLKESFDLVVMAGNVPLFTEPGTNKSLIAQCSRHLVCNGLLVCGFQLGRGYSLSQYDEDCSDAQLKLLSRWSSWGKDLFEATSDYAVSVHEKL